MLELQTKQKKLLNQTTWNNECSQNIVVLKVMNNKIINILMNNYSSNFSYILILNEEFFFKSIILISKRLDALY